MKAEDEIKRWTAKCKSALVQKSIKVNTTVAEASRAYKLSTSAVEGWVSETF